MRLKDLNIGSMTGYELVAWLDQDYPPRSPKLGTDPDRLWFDAGKRDLVDILLTKVRKEQNG